VSVRGMAQPNALIRARIACSAASLDATSTAAPCREVYLSLPTMAAGFPSACCTPRGRFGWSRRPVRRLTCSVACLDGCDGASSLSPISTHAPFRVRCPSNSEWFDFAIGPSPPRSSHRDHPPDRPQQDCEHFSPSRYRTALGVGHFLCRAFACWAVYVRRGPPPTFSPRYSPSRRDPRRTIQTILAAGQW
jgi:hypothetical protein